MGVRLGGVLAAVLVAATTGCGAASGSDSGATAAAPVHTMADGTVMGGATHDEHDADDSDPGDHDHGRDASGEGPSHTALMICGGQVADDVTRLMGLEVRPNPVTAWEAPIFTCTFELDEGPLVLRVHDVDDEPTGMAHFQQLRIGHADATPLAGVYSLGLPAYETESGTVAFVRDAKTLEVDATGLPDGGLGATGDQSRTRIAYAVATSVLACWTAHD